jgi:hypothetical protein
MECRVHSTFGMNGFFPKCILIREKNDAIPDRKNTRSEAKQNGQLHYVSDWRMVDPIAVFTSAVGMRMSSTKSARRADDEGFLRAHSPEANNAGHVVVST